MIRKILQLCPLALLLACSTIMNGPTQEMRIETPGAEGALCFFESPGYRLRAWAPNTVKVARTPHPLEITCLAPGNRKKVIALEPVVNDDSQFNAVTAGIGALVDYETGAMFSFPKLVVVDFTQMPARPMPLPAYQELLRQYPMLAGVESFRPGKAALQRDRYKPVPELQPRHADQMPAVPDSAAAVMAEPPAPVIGDKFIGGTAIIDDSHTAPVPLVPGGIK